MLCPFKTTKKAYLRRHNKHMHERKVECQTKNISTYLQVTDSSVLANNPGVAMGELEAANGCNAINIPEPKCVDECGSERRPDREFTSALDFEPSLVVRRPAKPSLPGSKRQHKPIPMSSLGKARNAAMISENPATEWLPRSIDPPSDVGTDGKHMTLPSSISKLIFADTFL